MTNPNQPGNSGQSRQPRQSGNRALPSNQPNRNGNTKQAQGQGRGQDQSQPVEQTPDAEIDEAQRADTQGEPGERVAEQEERRTEWVGRGIDDQDDESLNAGELDSDEDSDQDVEGGELDEDSELFADENDETGDEDDAPGARPLDKAKLDGNRPRP